MPLNHPTVSPMTSVRIAVTEKSVSNLINSLFAKLGLPPSADHHRRVLAVLSYLDRT
jgi:hypothetical protein